jgi:hypothetical protein
VREALVAAMGTVDRCKSDTRNKKGARAQAKQGLKKRLRGLINELGQLIPENDPRWSAFGFDTPADTQAPDAVQGLVLEGFAAGRVRGEWQESSRAERYWVEIFVVGQDQEFRRVDTVQDSDVELSLTPGAQVKVRIIAVNEAGPRTPSAEAEITVPLAEAA